KFAVKEKKYGIIFTGALGTLFAIVCAVILLIPIKGLNCSLGKESYICLAVWTVLGVIFSLNRHKKENYS
ncbi:MAG: APC family permease, partial [Butyrivibrio sp.]